MTVQPGLLADLDEWLLGSALGVARLAPSFFMLPFFNAGVLSGAARAAVIMIVSMGFRPMPHQSVMELALLPYLAALGQEVLVGTVLAVLLCWPFWIFHAVGAFIDNQRGATISSSIDPVNGEETSELSNFLSWFAAAVFLQGGGLGIFVRMVDMSYRLCGPMQSCQFDNAPVLMLLSALMTHMLAIAAPVIAAMLLCELALGLLSRFAPQLNAFSVSLTIKSLIALFVLLMYFVPFFPGEIARLSAHVRLLRSWMVEP